MITAAAVLLLLLAGCASGGGDPPPPDPHRADVRIGPGEWVSVGWHRCPTRPDLGVFVESVRAGKARAAAAWGLPFSANGISVAFIPLSHLGLDGENAGERAFRADCEHPDVAEHEILHIFAAAIMLPCWREVGHGVGLDCRPSARQDRE